MTVLMGPVLGFRGCDAARWRVSVLFVVDEGAPPAMHAAPGHVTGPVQLLDFRGGDVWRYDVDVPRGAADTTVAYGLAGETPHVFVVPGAGVLPRCAYASCNGFSDPKLMKRIADKNERWTHMASLHAAKPYHLLLMGGDQVYGDEVWTRQVPSVRDWAEMPRDRRLVATFRAEMQRQVEAFYFDLYIRRWSQTEPAAMFASVPTLMMWDDHDIFDGWGSHGDEENRCPVFQGIFQVAKAMFSVFQRHTAPGDTPPGQLPAQPGFTWAHVFDGIAMVAPDLRSERTNGIVLSETTWDAFTAWLDGLPAGLKHVYVLCSIPVVYADLRTIEGFLGLLPGEQELEDDLRDHWSSRPHHQERIRLVHRLFRTSRTKKARVTLLSGDVHVAAVGVIESSRTTDGPVNATVINQLTSSGVVHPPPPGAALWAIEHMMTGVDEIDRGIEARLMELPGASHKLVGARNWLALEPDPAGDIWANWHVEGETTPYTKVIHRV